MDPKVTFFFYLAAVACFVLAALGTRAPQSITRSPLSTIGLLPLGLALFVFPILWTTGELAF